MSRVAAPRPALVVGVGNPLCGDDGFGARVLALLREDAGLEGRADLLFAHTDLLGELDRLARYERVILVDAVLDPPRAGEVLVREEHELAAWPALEQSGHQLSPLFALRLFRELYPRAQTRVVLVGLCTEEVTLGEGLSRPEAVAAGSAAVRRLVLNAP